METEALPHDAADLRLAERLRALRRARRWSLDELSALSGVSRASLSRIENGDVSPTASVLGRLAAAAVFRRACGGDAPARSLAAERRI
jgi:transcriptional regulator with XRE-family HTH domain